MYPHSITLPISVKLVIKKVRKGNVACQSGYNKLHLFDFPNELKGKRTPKKSINFFLKFEKNNLKLAI